MSTLWTVSRIAKQLDVERHRVEYVLESRQIEPIGTAGIARVYDDAAVERVRNEMARMNEGKHVSPTP